MRQSVLESGSEETKRRGGGFVESWWRIWERFLWMILIWRGVLNRRGEVEMVINESGRAWEVIFIEFRLNAVISPLDCELAWRGAATHRCSEGIEKDRLGEWTSLFRCRITIARSAELTSIGIGKSLVATAAGHVEAPLLHFSLEYRRLQLLSRASDQTSGRGARAPIQLCW